MRSGCLPTLTTAWSMNATTASAEVKARWSRGRRPQSRGVSGQRKTDPVSRHRGFDGLQDGLRRSELSPSRDEIRHVIACFDLTKSSASSMPDPESSHSRAHAASGSAPLFGRSTDMVLRLKAAVSLFCRCVFWPGQPVRCYFGPSADAEETSTANSY